MDKSTNLFIIRHGEAWGAKTNIISGLRGDRGLTPLGKEQARRLRDRLAATGEIQADVLLASPLPRAKQTAEIIAPALGLPIQIEDDLEELRPGEADGITIAEAQERFGRVAFRTNPFQLIAPEGENWPGFLTRVGATLHRLLHEHEGKTLVLVCHGGIVDGSFYYFFDLSTLHLPRVGFYTHNTSITHWGQSTVSWEDTPRWRLFRYNDDLHLREGVQWSQVSEPERGAEEPSVPMPTEEE